MSREIAKKIKKNLLFRPLSKSAGALQQISAVDESVAGAWLLGAIRHALEQRQKVLIMLPRLDYAEEILRQLSLWRQTFDLPWSLELLNEMQRGRFYIAGYTHLFACRNSGTGTGSRKAAQKRNRA